MCVLYWIYGTVGLIVIINIPDYSSAKEANRFLLAAIGFPSTILVALIYNVMDIFSMAKIIPPNIWTIFDWAAFILNGFAIYKLSMRFVDRSQAKAKPMESS